MIKVCVCVCVCVCLYSNMAHLLAPHMCTYIRVFLSNLSPLLLVLVFLFNLSIAAGLKVRNHLDGRIYAIKCVRLHPELKSMNRKIMREVKLLSQLNHENVVRYYNAWIESYAADDLPLMSVLEEDEDSLLNQSTHSHGSSIDLERRTGTFTSGDDDDDSTSDEDSFISFEVPSVNEGEPVIVFEENSNSTLSSGSGGGGDSIAHSFDEPGDMVFSMSPSEYKWDTKNILALIDREVYA